MMLWCEIHNAAGSMKGSVTNFDLSEYEKDIAWLTNITQVRGWGLCKELELQHGTNNQSVCVYGRSG
jgi:hypothetical protein